MDLLMIGKRGRRRVRGPPHNCTWCIFIFAAVGWMLTGMINSIIWISRNFMFMFLSLCLDNFVNICWWRNRVKGITPSMVWTWTLGVFEQKWALDRKGEWAVLFKGSIYYFCGVESGFRLGTVFRCLHKFQCWWTNRGNCLLYMWACF